VLIIFTVILGAGATFMLDFEVESVQKRRIEVAKQLGNVLNNTFINVPIIVDWHH